MPVIFAVVGDLYYVHERGVRVALVTVSISGLANLPTVLSGVETTNLGWRWLFYMLGIFLGIGLVLVFLFGWETAYNRREKSTNLDLLQAEDVKDGTCAQEIENSEEEQTSAVPRKSFARRLSPFSGTYSEMPLWEMIPKPFLVLIHPAVTWATIFLAVTTAWYVVVSYVIAQIFAGPPHNLTAAQIGYMSAGPTVGATLASVVNGLISDPIARALARKNHGMYEPEFRLVLIVPMLVTCALGWFLFGNLIEMGKSAPVVSVVWALSSASMQFCLGAVGTYMVDAYPTISTEVFIIGMVVKNFLFFGLSCEYWPSNCLRPLMCASRGKSLGSCMGPRQNVRCNRSDPSWALPALWTGLGIWEEMASTFLCFEEMAIGRRELSMYE
jgi:MFS family permease